MNTLRALNLPYKVLFSAANVIVASISFFIAYKLILHYLTVEGLGLWALAISFPAISVIFASTFGYSASKLIGEYDQDKKNIFHLILASLVLVSLTSLIILTTIYWFSLNMLNLALTDDEYLLIKPLLFLIFISYFFNSVSVEIYFILDGLKKVIVKCLITIICNIFYVVMLFKLLSSNQGFEGIVLAFFIFQLTMFTILLCIVLWNLPKDINFKISNFNKTIKESIKYSKNIFLMNLILAPTEPVIKFFLNSSSSIAVVGIYDFLNKILIQIRSIFIESNKILIPYMSKEYSKSKENSLYFETYLASFYLALAFFIFIVFYHDFLGYLLFSEFNELYNYITLVLTAGYFANIISTPSYFSLLSSGKTIYLIYSHLFQILSLILLLIIVPLSIEYHIAAITISIFIGAFTSIFFFQKTYKRNIFGKEIRYLLLVPISFLLSFAFKELSLVLNLSLSTVILFLMIILLVFQLKYKRNG